jgi:Class II flagellar assembly regulator
MRIEGPPPLRRTAVRRDGDKADAAGDKFAAALEGGEPAAPAAQSPTVGALEGLLSIQEMPDALVGRRRAMLRGESLLDRLEDLRLGLLAGAVPRDRLEELARLARTARDAVDEPRLAAILDEIDLRAAVELAKLDAGR